MKIMRLSALVAALVGALVMAPSASAITPKNIEKQCRAMSTCNKGGVKPPMPCEIQAEKCPPCVTFDNNGCFELVNNGCNFGEDCSVYWSTDPSSSTGSKGSGGSTTGSKGSGTAGSNGSTGAAAGVAANSSSTNSTSSSKAGEDSSTGKAKEGTDMTVVFGIVGAAIGVIAVAVIFLVLVRRSRAAAEDDDEMAATPPTKSAAASGPSTTTNATSYAPYAQRAPANPTTPTNRVIKYYNDNAQPSPHGSRGGGGFGSQPQQQPPAKTVRPAAAANAPTFFNKPNPPMASMAPSTQAQAPVYQEHTFHSAPAPMPTQQMPTYQEHNYHHAQMAAPSAVPQAEPLFTVHTGPDEPQVVRRVSSPRPRRESYEF